ncbi:ATP-binding protein [Nocardia acidivorans]|uniref:ATP-binding protein n=1 Tax=Nocardia acidivorans TaxID=404580 RepID=UPI000835DA4F|nr:ATP-binding protein [Nocardia acidivorans]
MNEEQRHALSLIQFSSAVTPNQVWSPLTYHVDGLHREAVEAITRAVYAAEIRPLSTPTGLVLSGEHGVGKTHMLGWIRQHVQDRGGAFFMPKLIDGRSFWAGAVHGIVAQLLGSDGGQLIPMLDGLCQRTGCGRELRMRLRGNLPLSRSALDEFIDRFTELDAEVAFQCRDTLRALVLFQARAFRDIGHSFLTLESGLDDADRVVWGFHERSRTAQLIFGDLIRLFALTGPVVLAIDQIDSVIAQSAHSERDDLANGLADALMRMREETVRTLIVTACIPKSWELIATRAVNSAADRFTVLELSTAMPSTTVASAIVERHLGNLYGEAGFEPPFPTWPVAPRAFEDPQIAHFTPRRLLQQVEKHVQQCLATRTIVELEGFTESAHPITPPPAPAAGGDFAELDDRFAKLCANADVVGPLNPKFEDGAMFSLLTSALHCFVRERAGSGIELTVDPQNMVQPALHARLRRTLDEATEDQEHWSFRAISHSHHTAVLTRLRSACLEAGIGPGAGRRHLVILRNTPFSTGQATTATLAEFEAAQGIAVPISAEDLRVFTALEVMWAEGAADFHSWLMARRPAGGSQLFGRFLSAMHAEASAVQQDSGTPCEEPISGSEPSTPLYDRIATGAPSILIGRNVVGDNAFQVPLKQLRKHTAVFAGSGSGKTVLLRRLVEEAALHGVSSILIDTNNDLAQLGDRWPTPPEHWGSGDAERAERYFAGTEVLVWTPRRAAGRPLALNPLPDFSGVLDDPDEFGTSVDASVAGLLPRTGLTSRKLPTGTAVLTEAMRYFARRGGTELTAFVELLADLPDGVSSIRNASALATAMADELRAAMINDPVFGGAGERLDPGTLLRPSPGKHARISVISCIGLATEEQRQTFVNQLELALFAWIKQNPAGDRPLGGLLVLDEAQTFAPSSGMKASTESTLKLAAQARKYGLGLVFATQAPKGLHNMITGNAATQFFGHLNASVQIQAAKELARAKGGQVEDISRLSTGRFYGSTEGIAFGKLATLMCLSHHGDSALTEEEVLERARREPR